MNARRSIALSAVAVAFASGLAAAPATAAPDRPSSAVEASAPECTRWESTRLDGNTAGMKYKQCERTYQGRKQVSGAIYLWDNKRDGKEACGKITIPGSSWWQDWCWGDESHHSPRYNSGWHNGTDAKFGLFLV